MSTSTSWEAAAGRRTLLLRLFRWALMSGGLFFLARTAIESWSGYTPAFPSIGSTIAAFCLCVVWLVCAGQSWTALFDASIPRRPLARTYYGALLGRYIPGGIWQAAGQISMSRELGIPAASAGAAVFVQSVIHAAAGATVGAGLVVVPELPVWLRLVALGGLVCPLLIRRRVFTHIVTRVSNWCGRSDGIRVIVPPQTALLRSFIWAIGSVMCAGAAFGIVAAFALPELSRFAAVPAFAFAWTVGFLIVPIPAGVGIREGVLLLVFSAAGPVVVLISILHRLISMAAEVVVIALVMSSARFPFGAAP